MNINIYNICRNFLRPCVQLLLTNQVKNRFSHSQMKYVPISIWTNHHISKTLMLLHSLRKSIKILPTTSRHISTSEAILRGNQNSNPQDDEELKEVLKDFHEDFQTSPEDKEILEELKETEDSQIPRNDLDSSQKYVSKDNTETMWSYRHITKTKFKEFTDADSVFIPSIEEEELEETFYHIDQEHDLHQTPLVAKRGIEGVYDIDELVAVLRDENLLDIAVIKIPDTFSYADYMVLATAKSPKHARAVAEFVLKFYKRKKHTSDPFVVVEGEDSWKAVDMGNIVLHIFLEDIRAMYDIESLWLLDVKYDSGGTQQVDPILASLKEELEFFDSLNAEEISTAGSNDENRT